MFAATTPTRGHAPRRILAVLSALALGSALLAAPVSASAAPGLSLAGEVDGMSGGTSSPAGGVTVTLYGNDGLQRAQTVTDVAGLYSFAGVAPGSYQLHFSPADTDPLAPVWFGDSPYRVMGSGYVQLSSTSITGLDATLPEEGTISGTVDYDVDVDPASKPARVTAFLFDYALQTFQAASDPVQVDVSGNYTIRHLNEGDYAVRFDGGSLTALDPVYWPGQPLILLSDPVAVTAGANTPGIDQQVGNPQLETVRLAGADRFGTSVEVSKALITDPGSGIDSLWIANGFGFPDALSAGPAAAAQGAPLLLVAQNTIPPLVLAEIQRLNPARIYVAGGTGVVSTKVFNQLNTLATDRAIRLGGANRYETSRLIVSEAFSDFGAWTVTLADGRNYPDALAAGPAASKSYGPVVLINGSASAPDAATRQLLSGLNTISITLAGGTGVISSKLEQSLRATAGIAEVIRDGGANRYETANALNRRGFASADMVFLATGAGFADALAGGTAAGNVWAPLFLVQKTCVPQTTMDLIASLRPKVIFLLGGTGVLGSALDSLAICGGGSVFSSTAVESYSLGRTSVSGHDGAGDLLQQLRSANKWPVQPVSRPSGR